MPEPRSIGMRLGSASVTLTNEGRSSVLLRLEQEGHETAASWIREQLAQPSAFDAVARQRAPQILRTAYRILGNWADPEDVAQEVLVRLHKYGLRFPTDSALGAWLYRVTVNLCLDRIQSLHRKR